jgi:flagellar biosynthesis GTPase FlhF
VDLDAEKHKSGHLEKEKNALGGTFHCSIVCRVIFSFDPSQFTSTDVRGENAQLVMRLMTSISLDTMKQALEKKDKELALA